MKRLIAGFAIALSLSGAVLAQTTKPTSPGAEAYTPTRIEWLTTVLQATLRKDMTTDSKYLVQIVNKDPETIVLFVRHLPTVNKKAMDIQLNTAREVIKMFAKSYGWDKWLKVQEDIQAGK